MAQRAVLWVVQPEVHHAKSMANVLAVAVRVEGSFAPFLVFGSLKKKKKDQNMWVLVECTAMPCRTHAATVEW